ncbi:MAG: hypothetical protein WCK77_09010 [Verrucomicrobiota bacterium]
MIPATEGRFRRRIPENDFAIPFNGNDRVGHGIEQRLMARVGILKKLGHGAAHDGQRYSKCSGDPANIRKTTEKSRRFSRENPRSGFADCHCWRHRPGVVRCMHWLVLGLVLVQSAWVLCDNIIALNLMLDRASGSRPDAQARPADFLTG